MRDRKKKDHLTFTSFRSFWTYFSSCLFLSLVSLCTMVIVFGLSLCLNLFCVVVNVSAIEFSFEHAQNGKRNNRPQKTLKLLLDQEKEHNNFYSRSNNIRSTHLCVWSEPNVYFFCSWSLYLYVCWCWDFFFSSIPRQLLCRWWNIPSIYMTSTASTVTTDCGQTYWDLEYEQANERTSV